MTTVDHVPAAPAGLQAALDDTALVVLRSSALRPLSVPRAAAWPDCRKADGGMHASRAALMPCDGILA